MDESNYFHMKHNVTDPMIRVRAFAEVVKRQNFAAAARHLGMTTSAVSKQIQKLEDQLNVRLLQRTTRRIAVTEAGALYFERIQQLLEDWDEAERLVQQNSQSPRGILRISVPLSFTHAFLTPHLMAFATKYPDITLDIDASDRMVDLVQDGFDVGIRIGLLKDSSLIARKLAPCPIHWYASTEYLLQHGTPATPDDITKHKVIAYSQGDRGPRHWQYRHTDGTEGEIQYHASMYANNAEIMCEAAHRGLGLTLLPFFAVCKNAHPNLKPILQDYSTQPERNVYVVFPQSRHLSMKVRAFVDAISTINFQCN